MYYNSHFETKKVMKNGLRRILWHLVGRIYAVVIKIGKKL